MERIELFDNYIFDTLSPEEKSAFDARLKTDKNFAEDFKVYLLTLRGIRLEAEGRDTEFAFALQNISKEQLRDIMGERKKPKRNVSYLKIWMICSASAASVLLIFAFASVFFALIMMAPLQEGKEPEPYHYNIYDVIADYNYIPDYDRGEGNISDYTYQQVEDIIPRLEEEYRDAPADDVQQCQDAGMRLAMAYLKKGEPGKAVEILEEMKYRFSDDEEFVARCNRILKYL